jgi:MarR-like DNA-binding transcriptional regulator SgrR of sgrS sRNA
VDAQLSRAALLAATLVAHAVAPPVARGEGRPRYGGEVVATLLGRPSSFDPVRARGHADVAAIGLVYDALYRLDAGGAAVAHLAAAMPSVSADGKEARVPLIAGVTFHDGRPLTAADVVASLERARKALGYLRPIAGVRADGDAIVLALARPLPELAVLLAAPATSVTPGGRAPTSKAIGSGPFAVVAVDGPAGEMRLAAFAGHFAGRPYLDRVTLRWFQTADDEARGYERGALDLSLRGAVAFAGHQPKRATRAIASPPTLLVYLGFGKHTYASRALRRALGLAIGRDAMRGDRAVPTTSPLPVELGGEPGTTAADLPQARVALAGDAALAGRRFDVIVDRSRPDDRAIGEKVVAALYRLGLASTLVELTPAQMAERVRDQTYDIRVDNLALPTRDAGAAWAAAFAAGDDDWAARKLATGPLDGLAVRAAFAERLPIVPLVHRALRVHHRADLRRVELDALGRIGLADAYFAAAPADGGAR